MLKQKHAKLLPGHIWFIKLPPSLHVLAVEIEELTPNTVVLRRRADLGDGIFEHLLGRYLVSDVQFIERVPGKGPETVTSE